MRNLFPRKYRILSHVLFWIGVYALFMFPAAILGNNLWEAATLNLALLPFDMFAAYFVLYFLIPRYLYTQKYLIFFPAVIIFIIVYGVLIEEPAAYLIITRLHGADKWGSPLVFIPTRLLWTLVILLMITGVASAIKITKHWLVSLQEKQKLQRDMIQTELKLREAELKYLKSQIHPHFLFNTLNNLYGLTLEKSDRAPEVVVKLSEMLDFMLYEANHKLIPLKKEVKLLENYIGLEKIRYDEHLQVKLNKPVRFNKLEIAPFLLLAFAENAFKHGKNSRAEENLIIIKLKISGTHLYYEVINTIDNTGPDEESVIEEGIGLQNLRKRLELQYPAHFELTLNKRGSRFHANLVIDLSTQYEKP